VRGEGTRRKNSEESDFGLRDFGVCVELFGFRASEGTELGGFIGVSGYLFGFYPPPPGLEV